MQTPRRIESINYYIVRTFTMSQFSNKGEKREQALVDKSVVATKVIITNLGKLCAHESAEIS